MRKIGIASCVLLAVAVAEAEEPLDPGSAAAAMRIERKCEIQYLNDYSMRLACERNQRQAARELQEPIYDVPPKNVDIIRKHCATRYPDDFSMRLACQENQIRAFKELKNP